MGAASTDTINFDLPGERKARLGELCQRFAFDREGLAWGCMVVPAIGLVAVIAVVLTQNVSPWFYLVALVPAFFLFIAIYGSNNPPFVLDIHRNGVVIYHTNNAPDAMLWEELNYGEEQWSGGDYDLSFYYRAARRGGAKLFKSRQKNNDDKKIRALVYKLAYPAIRSLWAGAIKKNLPVEYRTATIQRDGIYFKKARRLLRWQDVQSFDIGGDWKVQFILPDGKRLRTGLTSSELPWGLLLFRFAEEVRDASV